MLRRFATCGRRAAWVVGLLCSVVAGDLLGQATASDNCELLLSNAINNSPLDCNSDLFMALQSVAPIAASIGLPSLQVDCNGQDGPTLNGVSLQTFSRSQPIIRKSPGFTCGGTIYINASHDYFTKYIDQVKANGEAPGLTLQIPILVTLLHEYLHALYSSLSPSGDKLACDSNGACRHAWVYGETAAALCSAASEPGLTESARNDICAAQKKQHKEAQAFNADCKCSSGGIPAALQPDLSDCPACS